MNNTGLMSGVNSQAEAETYLIYLDGTAYTHIPGLVLDFNDSGYPTPFRIIEREDGNLYLSDKRAYGHCHVLCQYQ